MNKTFINCARFSAITLVLMASGLPMAKADTVTFPGTTAGGPIWTRPIANNNGTFGGISSVATAVPYNVTPFFVGTTGNYNFLSTSVVPIGWDNYLFLYGGAFSSSTPASNYVIGNDDFPSEGTAGFDNVTLSTGNQYFLVTTGFFNEDSGTFSNRISGQGIVTLGTVAVPEIGSIFFLGATLLGTFIGRHMRQLYWMKTLPDTKGHGSCID